MIWLVDSGLYLASDLLLVLEWTIYIWCVSLLHCGKSSGAEKLD